MRVSDFVARLKFLGCSDVYMVTGGHQCILMIVLVLNLKGHCLHHEQACAIAAESFAKLNFFQR